MQAKILTQQGIQHLQNKDYLAAAKALAEADLLLPKQANVVHFLGLSLCLSGNFKDGIVRIRESLDLLPGNGMFLTNYANLLFENGSQEEAVVQYRKVLDADPVNKLAWINIGILYLAQGRMDEAEKAANKALAIDASDARTHNLLGAIFRGRKKPKIARPCFERALMFDPAPAEYHLNLALTLSDLDLLEEAIPVYRAALQRNPRSVAAYDSLGQALCNLGRSEEGFENLRVALSLDPDYANVHSNLGVYYTSAGMFEQADEHCRKALALNSDYPQPRYNLSILELTNGDFVSGFANYESRFGCDELGLQAGIPAGVPWQGQPLAGRRIFVFNEQGLGDTIQFSRYLPLLAQMGGEVIFECQPSLLPLLQPVLESASEKVRVISHGELLAAGDDFVVSLLSLPHWFGTTLNTVPTVMAGIAPSLEARKKWHPRFQNIPGGKIGVCWAGNPKHRNDRNRSIPFQQFTSIANQVAANFINLRKEPPDAIENIDVSLLWPSLLDFSDEFCDFGVTAACVAELDLVITVDTSIAHLAASLGKPTWVMVPFVPDWRWLLNRDDCPWYPSLRIFRQSQRGDWEGVIEEVNSALRRLYPVEPA